MTDGQERDSVEVLDKWGCHISGGTEKVTVRFHHGYSEQHTI